MIKIKALNYQYKNSSRKVLDQLSLTFQPNIINVIIGRNGAGKTTLFDIITRLISVPATIEGLPLESEIIYQLQGLLFPPTLTGKDLLRFFLYTDFRNEIKIGKEPYTDQYMTANEIDFMHRVWHMSYGNMSVGERRYLTILAITLMNRKLYIFDEPTSGVDPEARVRILNRIQRLIEDPDKIVILSTHTLHELKNYKCEIHLLHQGSLQFTGSYDQFLTTFNSEDPDTAFQNMINEYYV